MNHPLRLGIIGLGDVAVTRHLPVLTQRPHFQITTAAEIDAARAQRVAQQFSIPQIETDAARVIDAPNVDVIAIFTPPSTHAELAHHALNAGKHVFIEKPLTLDVADARELAAHVERANTKLLVGFNLRHHAQAQRAREILRAGELGPLRAASSFLGNTHARRNQSAWHRDLARGGDPFFEVGVHHFDLWRFLLDAEVNEIFAQEFVTAQGAATLTTQLRMSNAVLVTTTLAEDTLEHNAFEIIGERGKLQFSLYRFDGLRQMPRGAFDGSLGVRFADARNTLKTLPRALPQLRRGGEYVFTYRAEWEHFYHVIQNNVPPLASARDGAQATHSAHSARASVTQNKPISL